MKISSLAVLPGLVLLVAAFSVPRAPKLQLIEVGSDSTSFFVTATLIAGEHEAILYDAQYHRADAERLAEVIAGSGRKLKAIVLSHGDHDHYAGAAIIVQRFPGTPVYMTPRALAWYREHAPQDFSAERRRRPETLADSIVTPQPLPANVLTVDGARIEVLADLAGDVLTPSNTVLWIPSLRAVLAGDLLFDGVHPWLGSSNTTSRRAWRQAIGTLAALDPAIVVAGHKRDAAAPDRPEILAEMDRYLADFEGIMDGAQSMPDLLAKLRARFPERVLPYLAVAAGARKFAPPRPAATK